VVLALSGYVPACKDIQTTVAAPHVFGG